MSKIVAFTLALTTACTSVAQANLKKRMQAEADAGAALLQAEDDKKAIQALLPQLSHEALKTLRKTAEDLNKKASKP